MFYKKITAALLVLVLGLSGLAAESYESAINGDASPVQLGAELEYGFVKVLSHSFQSGDSGTNFNFVTQGGQEILFPFSRASLDLTLLERHRFAALYQPLQIDTTVTFRDAVTIDGVTFPSGTAMSLSYGFPFWRFTYGYDFFPGDDLNVRAGLALQLRNASIRFSSQDGELSTTNQNLGPVPALYTSAEYRLPSGIRLGFEATGIWASSAIINGADFEFEGSLLDTSLRASLPLRQGLETYVNIRFLGGSAVGVSEYEDRFWTQANENFTSNKLATLSLSAGLRIR